MAQIKKCGFLDWLLMLLFLAIGGFHEFIGAAVSAVLGVYLTVQVGKRKQLTLKNSLLGWSVAVLVFFYGFSALWAVDHGMAWMGFWKFLPLILYLVCLWQKEGSGNILNVLPGFGAVTVVLSVIGMYLPVVGSFFTVAGRLAGFFQYPNAYALFLLICQLLLLQKGVRKWDFLVLVVLLGGLLYTGSRTVFVLAVAANLVWFMLGGKKRLWTVLAAGGVLVLAAAAVLLWGEGTVLYRYLTISFTESTFVGRILYTVDALPLLLKYPFGMGYYGYYFAQTGVQTGVYSVAFAHNDILQLFLDVGWIPAGLFFSSIIVYFCRKDISVRQKLIPATVLVHCLFDFDLQFVSMFLLLLLLLEPERGSTVVLKKGTGAVRAFAGVLTAMGIYMTLSLGLSYFEVRELSDTLYPFDTRNKLEMLEKEADMDRANALAEDILKQNDHCYPAYSIKAKYAYSKGDFAGVIQYKNLAIRENPFNHTEYEEYCRMLINGISLYQQAGDENSVKICQQELVAVRQLLESNEQRLSGLGSMINDQPVTQLAEDIVYYIDNKIEGSE